MSLCGLLQLASKTDVLILFMAPACSVTEWVNLEKLAGRKSKPETVL
jgi:hypothetical protein